MFSALGLGEMLGMFGFEQNILSEYSHSLEFRNYLCVCSICLHILCIYYSKEISK